jgi:D-alanyl-D-alanine dipeptidase
VMEDAGFIQLPLEWWHYDALPRDEVMRSYSIVE